MSFHNKPNYQIPELIEALKAHRLPHDTPSQLADSFRIGWMACRELAQATAAQAVVQDPITIRKPTTRAEMLWLLKLAHLVISDVDKTLEETFAPAQPAAQQGAAYAALPDERAAFEAQFPVPGGVHWDGTEYVVKDSHVSSYRCNRFEGQWEAWKARASHGQAPAGAGMGHTDGGRNMFYEGRFDGESQREQQARLRWANDMRAAFERHTGNGWFDKDWRTETGLWSSAWHACLAAQPSPTAQAAESVPAIQGEMNVQLDIDSNHSAPGQQRDVARSVALGQPMGNGQDQAAGHLGAQGDKLLTVAARNIRSFLRSATFKSESDREAALNCVDVLWAAARDPADSVQEDAARWNVWASGMVEACNSDEQEPAFLVALDKAIGDAEPPITLELLNEWTDAARKQGGL